MIELVDFMGNDLRVANVARVSFNKWKEEFDQKDAKLLDFLARNEHNSPFRHTAITIRCKEPIFIARQLGKHQVGLSWNEVSRRYVDTGFEFFSPREWRSRPDANIKQGSGEAFSETTQKELTEAYNMFVDLAKKFYDKLLEDNVAPEQARMVLPQSMMAEWVWTGSLEAFFHVYRLRAGHGAQGEALDFANKLNDVIEPLFPECWRVLKEYS